jgi:hypothetical protein
MGKVDVRATKDLVKSGQGHVPAFVNFLRDVSACWKGEALNGSFVVMPEDGLFDYWTNTSALAPSFCFSRLRNDYTSLLMPDPAFTWSGGLKNELTELATHEKNHPWEKKYKQVFWRGSNSNKTNFRDKGDWSKAVRVKFCQFAQRSKHAHHLDIALSRVIDCGVNEYSEWIETLNILRPAVDQLDFFKSRYQLDMEGVACTWISLLMKLRSKCAVLKVSGEYEQWFYPLLQEWKNYIPLEPNGHNFDEIIRWILHNDKAGEQIGNQSFEDFRVLRYETAREEMGHLLLELFKNQKDRA